jgi:hypothetical protein
MGLALADQEPASRTYEPTAVESLGGAAAFRVMSRTVCLRSCGGDQHCREDAPEREGAW